jgi:hypothetical protein
MTVLLENLPSAEKIAGKSTLQQFIEIGEERGLERGLERAITALMLNKPDFSDQQIASLLSVDLDFVKKVRLKSLQN